MQAVVKMPHISVNLSGTGVKEFIELLKSNIPDINIVEKQSDSVNIEDTEWYQATKKRITPAVVLKVRRENAELTQMQLAEKTGIKTSNIALMETGKRNIGARTAKKLAEALNCSVSDFVR